MKQAIINKFIQKYVSFWGMNVMEDDEQLLKTMENNIITATIFCPVRDIYGVFKFQYKEGNFKSIETVIDYNKEEVQ